MGTGFPQHLIGVDTGGTLTGLRHAGENGRITMTKARGAVTASSPCPGSVTLAMMRGMRSPADLTTRRLTPLLPPSPIRLSFEIRSAGA
jgi:hypothetical protein